ncbi:hypothetical protein C0Q70_17410 [Pomacea canaliculata]|uniref:Methyltransferase type 11 domain-containing protein n=2 Tax=Pomacea canaliculata TaxID=400727 RepID=A0A2T7NKC6_POMCA|nr:hypothetical protein C0Q70_17410 [Pomacea canaliculata]
MSIEAQQSPPPRQCSVQQYPANNYSDDANLVALDQIIFDGIFREVSSRGVRELLLHAQLHMSEGNWCTAKSLCRQALDRCSNELDRRKLRLVLTEMDLYQDRAVHELLDANRKLDWVDIGRRPVEKLFESHHDMPQSIFFIRHENSGVSRHHDDVGCSVRFTVGRRLLSHQYRAGKIGELHCSLITPTMLLGTLEDQRVREDGVVIYYRPFLPAEKLLIMHRLLEESNMADFELVYPFPVLHPVSREELCCPTDGWQISEELAEQLEEGEEILRECSREFLRSLKKTGLRLFDPACCNGIFLEDMKRAVADAYTVGQDLSSNMVRYARSRLDEVHCGDCRQPAIADNSVDVVFCRFLNSEVVKTADVMELLLPPSRCVKVGGHLVIFGHTPVLLSAADLRQLNGWKLLSCVAGSARWNGIFQFYVCQRIS